MPRSLAGLILLIAVSWTAAAGTGADVLNVDTHADTYIAPAIGAVLGSGVVDNSIHVDYYPQQDVVGAIQAAANASASEYSVASGNAVNHAPYGVINGSYCCSGGEADDTLYYGALYNAGAILSSPRAAGVSTSLPAGTGPPTCNTAVSSPDSSNGGSSWGIEFGLSAGYLGLNTTTDSWNSAAMAGLLSALKHNHPSWNWFDVKAALRQTASNWATSGYSHSAFGYGYVDWTAANSIAPATSLYLQPPGVNVKVCRNLATITLYPFRQTRRHHEEIYLVAPFHTWPLRNEYTSQDIVNAGGTLLYTSNATDFTPTFVYNSSASGTPYVVAFTADGHGNYSRVEEFSVSAVQLGSTAGCSLGQGANVLNVGTNADTKIAPAIAAVRGNNAVDSAIFVDYSLQETAAGAIRAASDVSATEYSAASASPVHHVPYGVVNSSICCSSGAGDDSMYYSALYSANAILSSPLGLRAGGPLLAGSAPPTYSTAVSSPNASDGGSGWGIEFGLSAGYLGLDTSTDAANSAAMAGFLAGLRELHPDWSCAPVVPCVPVDGFQLSRES